jgi:hypothetical protein
MKNKMGISDLCFTSNNTIYQIKSWCYNGCEGWSSWICEDVYRDEAKAQERCKILNERCSGLGSTYEVVKRNIIE